MTAPTDIASLPDLLLRQARSLPDQHLVRWGGTALTYAEFDARTDKLAAGLAELGVAPGDVVSIYLPNCLEFLEAWWATLKAGGVFGPINAHFTGPVDADGNPDFSLAKVAFDNVRCH